MTRKAPGKSHREGLTLVELFEMFPDETTAAAWFESVIWPTGRHCPKCGSLRTNDASHRKMPYWCTDCRSYFSVKTGTAMQRSKIPLRKWAIAIYLCLTSLKSVSSMKLRRDIGVSQPTAWFMLHRIREAWAAEGDDRFDGPVEADEAYFGGKRKNKPKHQRPTAERTGIVGKTIVAGVRDRATNRVDAAVIPDTSRGTLHAFVEDRTEPTAKVYTDEHPSYRNMRRRHEAVQHSTGEYVRGEKPIRRASNPSGPC